MNVSVEHHICQDSGRKSGNISDDGAKQKSQPIELISLVNLEHNAKIYGLQRVQARKFCIEKSYHKTLLT
jgi:hypothetical protein